VVVVGVGVGGSVVGGGVVGGAVVDEDGGGVVVDGGGVVLEVGGFVVDDVGGGVVVLELLDDVVLVGGVLVAVAQSAPVNATHVPSRPGLRLM